MKEEWKWVPGFERAYEVSSQGRIRSYVNRSQPRALKPFIRCHGYYGISLGAGFTALLHRVVALTFIQNPFNLPEVNHIDGEKGNNSVQNLEWVTSSQNKRHACALGLMKPPRLRGEDAKRSHLTNHDVYMIRQLYKNGGNSHLKLSLRYGVSRHAIRCIVNRRTWTHI